MTQALATTEDFAQAIGAVWRRSFEAVIEAGQLIAQAKERLVHGEFIVMINERLPFKAATAQRLMKIAADPKITNAAHAQHLPASWATLYEITKLDEGSFQKKIEQGVIRPDMERRDITNVVKKEARVVREQILATKQRALPDKEYNVILADPEWRFEPYSRISGMDRAADNQYPTSELEKIKARDVPSIAAADCVLFLWATVPMLPHALEVMAAWGFQYKTHCIWHKDRRGTGYWFRNLHELLLLGTKGNIPAPAMGDQWDSVIDGKVTEHSAKPLVFRGMIQDYFPNLPKMQLNAREAWPGWDCWGNEAPVLEVA